MKTLYKMMNPFLLVCGLILHSLSAQAVEVEIKIKGEIYIPPCKVNNNAAVDISFGNLSVRSVNGQASAITKTLNVSCDYYSGKPYIVVESTDGVMSGVAENNVLNTKGVNAGKLGIALYQGNGVDPAALLKIGTGGEAGKYGYPITKGLSVNGGSGQFIFTAVPWKKSSDELTSGNFTASATMSIIYL